MTHQQTNILVGSVAENETAVIVVTGEQLEAGSSPNRFTMAVYDAKGQDVSTNYTISPSFGELTVFKRSLTLLSDSSTKTYDGEALVNETVTIEAGSVAEGQSTEIHVTGTITNVGEVENVFTVQINDEAGNDVTANYEMLSAYGATRLASRYTISLNSPRREVARSIILPTYSWGAIRFTFTKGSSAN